MAKYCKTCGKELHGKDCDCESKVEEKEELQECKENQIDSLNYINAFIETTKHMFLRPVSTMKSFIQAHHLLLGITAIIINSILFSLFLCLVTSERMDTATLWIIGYGGEGLSYIKMFVQTLCTLLILYASFGGLLYLITDKIYRYNTSYQKMISLLGIVSMIAILTNLGAILCIYLSVQIMTIVLGIGFLLCIFCFYSGFDFVAKIDENKKVYILVLAITILFIIGTYVIPSLLS